MIVSKNVQRRHLNAGQRSAVAFELKPLYEQAAKERQRAGGGDRKSAAAKEIGRVRLDTTDLGSLIVQAEHPALQDQDSAGALGRARDMAARAVGASNGSTARYSYVAKNAPDLAEQVKAGTIMVDAAYRQAQQRVRAMPKPEQQRGVRQLTTDSRVRTGLDLPA